MEHQRHHLFCRSNILNRLPATKCDHRCRKPGELNHGNRQWHGQPERPSLRLLDRIRHRKQPRIQHSQNRQRQRRRIRQLFLHLTEQQRRQRIRNLQFLHHHQLVTRRHPARHRKQRQRHRQPHDRWHEILRRSRRNINHTRRPLGLPHAFRWQPAIRQLDLFHAL